MCGFKIFIAGFKSKEFKAILKNQNLWQKGIRLFILALIILICYGWMFGLYDQYIIPLLGKFHSSIPTKLLFISGVILTCIQVYRNFQFRYRYNSTVILVLLICSMLLLRARFSGDFEYIAFFSKISYVDILIGLCVLYVGAALVNSFRILSDYFIRIEKLHHKMDEKILRDWPIDNNDDDILDIGQETQKIAEKIELLSGTKAWSIAITAPWGAGKTSFLNLVQKQLIAQGNFIIIPFVPRDSKSYSTIQEDFFSKLSSELSKYDYKCNRQIKKYMASLQLIDNRGFFEKILKLYRIWNKEDLKNDIKQTFLTLNKRVLVMIDDFDRLSKEEILEVLKLIDNNAAFSNLIFLTAYDKSQVNNSLGTSYQTKDACFVDKFFNIEYSLPSRPYSYIADFIIQKISSLSEANAEQGNSMRTCISQNISIISKYIPTLRDAKRFINQFVLDFDKVKGDVVVEEYILVELVKYRYPDSFKAMYNKEFFDNGGHILDGNRILYLKETLDEQLEILPVLKILFPRSTSSITSSYLHIYDIQSFNNYFVNQIYASLRIADMRNTFSLDWDSLVSQLEIWVNNQDQFKDYIEYISSLNMVESNMDTFIRYAEILTFLACKRIQSRAYWLFLRVIYMKNIEKLADNDDAALIKYKDRIFEILNENVADRLSLFKVLHMQYVTLEINEMDYLIKDADIWPYIRDTFIQSASNLDFDESLLRKDLYQCAVGMEDSRRLLLDNDCLEAYRSRVEQSPQYYISHFVFLGGVSSNVDFNNIVCEPFWNQIFKDKDQFEEFLKKCLEQDIDGAQRAWNFWELYKENDFQPLSFENQGSVQEKIDSNLNTEFESLKEMRKVKEDVVQISKIESDLLSKNKEQYLSALNTFKEKLDSLQLYISLNGKIHRMIEGLLQKISTL